tara:strand:+ start:524 stop:781 length:258 start_codon:yes stop_codon:yes gene_type:complete
MKRLALALVLLLTTASCTDAEMSKLGGFSDSFKVELLNCDGAVARRWISSGKVMRDANSGSYYFKDSKSKVLIEVTGTLVITKLD